MGRPNINIRFETKTQVEKIRRAAKAKKWSFNQFVVDAAENAALTAEAQSAFRALGAQFDGDKETVATNS